MKLRCHDCSQIQADCIIGLLALWYVRALLGLITFLGVIVLIRQVCFNFLWLFIRDCNAIALRVDSESVCILSNLWFDVRRRTIPDYRFQSPIPKVSSRMPADANPRDPHTGSRLHYVYPPKERQALSRVDSADVRNEYRHPSISSNPFVPVAAVTTAGMVAFGLGEMLAGNPQKMSQYMGRRVLFQGLTIAAVAAGFGYRYLRGTSKIQSERTPVYAEEDRDIRTQG